MTTTKICDVEPFRYQSVPQPTSDQGAQSNQINETYLEDYLNRMRSAICDDIQAIVDECCNGGGGGGSFLDLSDTPVSYAGDAGQSVIVNGGETGLVFATPAPQPDDDGLHLDLSTTEQATNRTDTTGATIYQKTVISAGNFATGTTNVAHGITGLNKMVALHAIVDRSNGAQLPVPFASTTSTFSITLQIDATNIIIGVGTSWAGVGNVISNLRITLFYTKS